MLSRSCLGNRLVRGAGKAAKRASELCRTHARTYVCARTNRLIKRPTETASTYTGPQEVTALSLEMGCVFFGVLHYPRDYRQQIELSPRITHTENTRGSTRTCIQADRIREGDGRWSCDTHRDTQINMLSLMFLGDGNSLLLDCLDQEKEKESG